VIIVKILVHLLILQTLITGCKGKVIENKVGRNLALFLKDDFNNFQFLIFNFQFSSYTC